MLRVAAFSCAVSISFCAAVSSAVTLTPVMDIRYIDAYQLKCINQPYEECTVRSRDYQEPPGDYAAWEGAASGFPGQPGAVAATQRSSFSPMGIEGEGSVVLSAISVADGRAEARSGVWVRFTLDEPALLSLQADLSYTVDLTYPGSFSTLEPVSLLASLQSGVDIVTEILTADGTTDHDSAHIDFEAILPAGEYALFARAEGRQYFALPAFATLDYAFALQVSDVPEPTMAPLSVLALIVLASRRLFAVTR